MDGARSGCKRQNLITSRERNQHFYTDKISRTAFAAVLFDAFLGGDQGLFLLLPLII